MKNTLKKLRDTKEIAEAEVHGDYRTKAGREGDRRQAQQALPELRKKFRDAFSKVAHVTFLYGPGKDNLIAKADTMTEVVAVDYSTVIKEISVAVEANLTKHREFTPGTFAVLLREVRAVASKVGLKKEPDLSYDGVVVAKPNGGVDALVGRYLEKYVGTDFIASMLEAPALLQGENLSGDAKIVPVFVTSLPKDMVEGVGNKMFGGKYSTLAVDDGEVTEEEVVEMFDRIGKQMLK